MRILRLMLFFILLGGVSLSAKPNIVILATGGTIVGKGSSAIKSTQYEARSEEQTVEL